MTQLSEHFDRIEFACKCACGHDTVDTELLMVLEHVRQYFEKPVIITSGCRCEEHNRNVGGKVDSLHLFGKAADFVVVDIHPHDVYNFLACFYTGEYGIGKGDTYTHIDIREKRSRWTY